MLQQESQLNRISSILFSIEHKNARLEGTLILKVGSEAKKHFGYSVRLSRLVYLPDAVDVDVADEADGRNNDLSFSIKARFSSLSMSM